MSNLCQFFTPQWAAEVLFDRHFHRVGLHDLIIEPSCGPGAFLKAVPSSVPAIGVEIDPAVAEIARRETGREIIVGDFRSVVIDAQPTLIVGNPPFNLKVIDGFFDRAHDLLPDGGQMAFLLPAYAMQTAKRVAGYSERWSIYSEMIPRNIFKNLSKPLVFSIFTKDARRMFYGMALYLETTDAQNLSKVYREAISVTTGSIWKAVCKIALERLGGVADLQSIYQEVEGHRPSTTKFWREQIRKTLRVYPDTFKPLGSGRYAKGAW